LHSSEHILPSFKLQAPIEPCLSLLNNNQNAIVTNGPIFGIVRHYSHHRGLFS